MNTTEVMETARKYEKKLLIVSTVKVTLGDGKMVKIVWNGVDNYVEIDAVVSHGYDFAGHTLYRGARSYEAFDVVEVDPATLPRDEDGEVNIDGILGSESGKLYRLPSHKIKELKK